MVGMFEFAPEEFIVEEITKEGLVLELDKQIEKEGDGNLEKDYFTHFILQKREWNTLQALSAISRALHIGAKRLNFAGTKDRNAITTQLCSAFAVPSEKILSLKIKDIQINGAWKEKEKVRLGDLLGNRFTITLSKENCGKNVEAEKIKKNASKNNYCIPNYFGQQRFGSMRGNSHLIGKLMLQGKYEEAVLNFLCFPGDDKLGAEARKQLEKEKDFAAALGYFPRHLKYERTILGQLAKNPRDFIGAFRKLPRTLQLIFIHAFQSFLFNELLKKRVEEKRLFVGAIGDFYCNSDSYGFPEIDSAKAIEDYAEATAVNERIQSGSCFLAGHLIGYETDLTQDEAFLLEREGIEKEAFRLKSMPELHSKGSLRPLFVPLKDFAVLFPSPVKIGFSLPSGSYATVAIEELKVI
ncbi:tRNA pseudouridine(13) synthase TruD [Candidatus Micrarchaeota archaeon]|nr:tRNA pseudouridine(13) synthase TruD [Candidatus Micrarchaeota archaeon]